MKNVDERKLKADVTVLYRNKYLDLENFSGETLVEETEFFTTLFIPLKGLNIRCLMSNRQS